MGSLKTVLGNDGVRRLLCWLGALYIRFVYATNRWRWVRGDTVEGYWRDDTPFIVAFWHGRLLLMPCFWPPAKPVHMLISQHRDGQLIARTIGHFGVPTIAGSTRRGGAGALRALIKAIRAGGSIGITPDGPRGPRMRVGDGIVTLARM